MTKSGCRESKGSLVVDEDRGIMKNQLCSVLKAFEGARLLLMI